MGSSAPKKQEQTNTVKLSPQQEALYNLAQPHMTAYANSPLEMYGGNTLAGFDPLETQAHGMALASADQFNGLAQQGAQAQSFLLSPNQLNPDSNPYAQAIAQQIASGISDNFTQNLLPAIQGSGIQSGGMYGSGGTRQLMAEHLGTQGAMDATGDALEKFYFDNYNLGISNMQRALDQNRQVGMDMLFPGDVYSMVGGQQRTMEQAEMDEAYKSWAIEQQLPFLRSQEIMSLLASMPGGTGVTTMQGVSPSTNPLTSALGGGMSGASLGAMTGLAGGGPIGALLGALAGYAMSR